VIIFIGSILSACSANSPSIKPKPVEVWCSGDDGLTLRLRDSVENELQSSSDFVLSYGEKPGTLVVTIPTNVRWEGIGKRPKAFYTVAFTSIKGQNIGVSEGSCWDDELTKCSAEILKDAKAASYKIK
jgi:hypothetical protein